MKYYNKYFPFFFSNLSYINDIDKVSEHFKNNKVALYHKSLKSPGRWQHNAIYRLKISEQYIFEYRTYRQGNADYIKNIYNDLKLEKSPLKRLNFLRKKIAKQTNGQPTIYKWNGKKWELLLLASEKDFFK